MREILFRGKGICDGEWMFGSLVKVADECVIIAEDAVYYGGSDFSKGCAVDPATVGQFTGLKDKNGVRIFEGDICRVLDLLYKVEFKHSCWWFTILSNKVYCCPAFNSNCGEYCEVIGNIHDNPEMLEGGCR